MYVRLVQGQKLEGAMWGNIVGGERARLSGLLLE
jgi:hypothetical protein